MDQRAATINDSFFEQDKEEIKADDSERRSITFAENRESLIIMMTESTENGNDQEETDETDDKALPRGKIRH